MLRLTDLTGKVHAVIACKPKSANPKDDYLCIILHKAESSFTPYVVHDMNLQTGGCHNGRYCASIAIALGVFSQAE